VLRAFADGPAAASYRPGQPAPAGRVGRWPDRRAAQPMDL